MNLLLALATLMGVGNLVAQVRPQIAARQGWRGEVTPKTDRFEVDVLLFEDLAQTTITVSFKNTSNRNTEGELTLPLPKGATISGYQLEVNGRMRDSTAVARERARFAYESIKRQNIDPGYIERLPGNLYRTRIFPILGNSSKAVSLTYCHPLGPQDDQLRYRLLLPQISVDQARVSVTHFQGREIEILHPPCGGDTSWQEKTDQKTLRLVSSGRVTLDQFHLSLPLINEDLLVETREFSYQRKSLGNANSRLVPKNVEELELIWDCSESGRSRDHAKEFAYLDQLFRKHPNLKVTLVKLRMTPGKPLTFAIKEGNWDTLREALEGIFYDGGTDLGSIKPRQIPTLVFSDGRSFHSRLPKPWSEPVSLIDSSGAASLYWIDQILLSGGTHLDLTHPVKEDQSISRKFFRARKANPSDPENQTEGKADQILKTLWASEKLRAMEREFIPNRQAIIAFCREHQLVSSETSLIVLERFEDHVRYRIPPPEKELLAKYQLALDLEMAEPSAEDIVSKRWQARKNWHAQDFPWQDHLLDSTMARIAIWRRALLKTFEEQELNQTSLQKIAQAFNKIGQLKARKSSGKLDNLEDYHAWLKDLEKTTHQLSQLDELTYGLERNGHITIAINGFVNSTGKITTPTGTTLKSALQKAGGISKIGSAS
jgi:hypothetical protein